MRYQETKKQNLEAIETINLKIERLMTAVAEGLPASEVSKAISELSAKKRRLERLENVQVHKPIAVDNLLKKARELRKRLECSDDGQKRLVLKQFIRSIIVHPDKKQILIKVKSPLPLLGMDSGLGHSCGSPLCISSNLFSTNSLVLKMHCSRSKKGDLFGFFVKRLTAFSFLEITSFFSLVQRGVDLCTMRSRFFVYTSES